MAIVLGQTETLREDGTRNGGQSTAVGIRPDTYFGRPAPHNSGIRI